MTSSFSKKGVVLKPHETRYYLGADKNGYPINGQVARTVDVYTGTGGTIVASGKNDLFVNGILSSTLIVNMQDTPELIGRRITVTVRPGATQIVRLLFPAAGYTVYVDGGAAAVTQYDIPVSANAQNVDVIFGPDVGVVIP
jgi:hypothetical protein